MPHVTTFWNVCFLHPVNKINSYIFLACLIAKASKLTNRFVYKIYRFVTTVH
jgi:hypothetical protein